MVNRTVVKKILWLLGISLVLVGTYLFRGWYAEVNRGDYDRFNSLQHPLERKTLTRTEVEGLMRRRPDRVGTVADQAWLLKLNDVDWGMFDSRCVKVLEYDIVMDGVTPPIPILFHTDQIYGRIGIDATDHVVAYMQAIH